MKKTYVPLAVLSLLLAASPLLKASSVTINNFSFENPAQGPGGYSQGVGDVTDWILYTGLPGGVNGQAGVQYFTSQYISATPLPSPADGNQAVYVNQGGALYQDVGALLPNTVYTLTVAVGNRSDQGQPTGNAGTISLYDGVDPSGTQLATSTLLAPVGTFEDETITYQTGNSVFGDLLVTLVDPAGSDNANFDNVRLDATAVPEPSTYALLASSVLGFAFLKKNRQSKT